MPNAIAFALAAVVSSSAAGQTSPQTPVRAPGTTVVVTAQKEPADPATLPVSVTTVSEDVLTMAGVTFISDIAALSPNTYFNEFTARKLSNARIRGVGSSPANPGVTTYVDGVPQLNANSSSFDLIDVDQIEFARGPNALFGRNALGGMINIQSARPAMSAWTGQAQVPFGSDSELGLRANISGPIMTDKLAVGFAGSYGQRDGYTQRLDVSGNVLDDVDSREGYFLKGQVLWTPTPAWETRVIVSNERARDGDYALNDLNAVRSSPFEVMRDFIGHTDRDILNTTILVRNESKYLTFNSITGFGSWKTMDETDLDYSALPAAVRENTEEARQFTQEVRVASKRGPAVGATAGGGSYLSLGFQAGALVFTQNFDQFAVNAYAPFVLSPFVGFGVVQTSPEAALDDLGFGIYGQGILDVNGHVDVTFGARYDRERRDARISTVYSPEIAPPSVVDERRTYSQVSPQVSATWRVRPGTIVYGSASKAFKAGGFNPVSLPGQESYDEELAWNYEGGVKTSMASGKFALSAAVFSIDWTDLQLNLPIFGAPGQFFIDNVGGATSRGVEFELMSRPYRDLDLFASVGTTRAVFDDGTSTNALDVSGNKVPNAPAFTTNFGAQYSYEVRPAHRLYGRVDISTVGAFEYDEANTARQDAHTLTNFRFGLQARYVRIEGYVRNAFDTRYVPLAFAYPGMPSGFVGEPGRPRTWGVNLGIGF